MWRWILLFFPLLSTAQTNFNVSLLDSWTDTDLDSSFNGTRYSDCWGYEQNGEEYAMLGSTEGVHFFHVGANDRLELLDFVPGKFASGAVVHRDIKTFRNYAFLVCDEGMSSLQIVDLQFLPDSVRVIYENDSTFARVHNLFIDEPNELLYACSVQPAFNGILQPLISMQVYALADILNPVLVYEGPNDIPEVHDAYIRDNIAYLNCGFDGIRVYDFSIPTTPQFLQNLNLYQEQGYNHQGWLSPDGNRYVFADETDGSSVKSCSVGPNYEISILGAVSSNAANQSVPHNVMITNEFAFVAYYNEGLRVYDLRSNVPKEIAFYDTYPEEEDVFNMNGAWGIYSQLSSERLLVSDRKHGLFLLDFNRSVFTVQTPDAIILYPNPAPTSSTFTLRLEENREPSFFVEIHDIFGRAVFTQFVSDANYVELPTPESSGLYSVRISYPNEDQQEVVQSWKLLVY